MMMSIDWLLFCEALRIKRLVLSTSND